MAATLSTRRARTGQGEDAAEDTGAPAAGEPVIDRWQPVLALVGAALLPLGLVVIGLGWYGAAHSPYTFEQVPYAVSGGLFGLGLVLTGGFLYFGSWIARLAALTEAAARGARAAAAGEPPAPAANGTSREPAARFLATQSGGLLHRPDCPMLAHKENLRAVSPQDGFKPCRLCDPLGSR